MDKDNEKKVAIARYMTASSLLLYIGPLYAQSIGAGDSWPPQTHEAIRGAYNQIKKTLEDNSWAMKSNV